MIQLGFSTDMLSLSQGSLKPEVGLMGFVLSRLSFA